jgi:hypothetical protein
MAENAEPRRRDINALISELETMIQDIRLASGAQQAISAGCQITQVANCTGTCTCEVGCFPVAAPG